MQVAKELDLDIVTEILRELFGYGSMLSLSFIREVVPIEDKKVCPTLSIDPHGTLRYNPEFFREHVNTERKLKEVILHELMHPVLGDMHRRASYTANFASDMVINALVTRILGHGDLFEEMYPERVPDDQKSIGGLLRPSTDVRADGAKYINVYQFLWRFWGKGATAVYNPALGGMHVRPQDIDSIEEVREIMEILMTRYRGPAVKLIGGHGHTVNDSGGRSDPMDPTLPTETGGTFDDISDDLKDILADEIVDLLSKSAGYSDELANMAIKDIKANVTVVRKLLEDFSASSEFNSFKRYMKETRRRRSIFPRGLSRRDAALIGAGVIPVFFQSNRTHMNPRKDGMNVYVDVSGSMWGYLPKILGFLRATKGFVEGIYQFSNKVVPTTLNEMFKCKGKAKIDSTGGTDYNCIIDHAIASGVRKVVVMTDGYADCDVERRKACLANIDKACVIYTKNHKQDEFWVKNYHRSYDLDQLFRAC